MQEHLEITEKQGGDKKKYFSHFYLQPMFQEFLLPF